MAKAATKTADELVLEALEKALRQGRVVRLVTFGKSAENAGLFPDDTKAMSKKAIDACISADPPLLVVEREEEKMSGGKSKVHRFVAITPAGASYLVSKYPSERIPELLAQSELSDKVVDALIANPQLPQETLAVLLGRQLESNSARLEALENDARAVGQAFAGLEELINGFIERTEAVSRRIESELRGIRERTENLKARLNKPVAPTTNQDGPKPIASGKQDRRALAQQMVFAWEEATSPEEKERIACALRNGGIEPIGTAGERINFVGRLHEGPGVFQDDPVEIVQPGWMLRDDIGEYLLAKAKVAPK